MNVIKVIIPFLLLIAGCRTTGSVYALAVQEHRQDTLLVNQALIDTFKEEMDKETRPEAKAAYAEIIANLETISHQADILYRYTWKTLSEQELSSVIREKWRAK